MNNEFDDLLLIISDTEFNEIFFFFNLSKSLLNNRIKFNLLMKSIFSIIKKYFKGKSSQILLEIKN